MINVVLPCCKADEDQAIRLLEWMGELGKKDAKLFILCADDCQHQRMVDLGSKAFSHCERMRDAENIKSNWRDPGHENKSAEGPNSLFRQAVWNFYLWKLQGKAGAWLFLEPDAIPCRRDWLELLDNEYIQSKKPFMGFLVNHNTHPGDVGAHMSGVAIYPDFSAEVLKKSILHSPMAFDMAAADITVPNMHSTNLIFHRFRPPPFTTQEDFETRVPGHLALYHACKDGSVIPFLRKRLGMKGGEENCTTETSTVQSTAGIATALPVRPVPVSSNGAQRSDPNAAPAPCDIFIKTRSHDYPWLEWCRKSIHKYCRGVRQAHTLHDGDLRVDCTPVSIEGWGTTLFEHHGKPKDPGYLWQQVCKLHADQYTDAEWILYMDSDCVFTRPVSPSDFIKDGKPVWLYTPLDQARPDQHVWAPVMEKFLGKKPEHEFMRRHPFIVQRWMLDALRTFCKYRHGKSLEDYIMGQAVPGSPTALVFSEWNCLGFFLWEYHRDSVAWVLDSEADPACVYQGFTHGGEGRKAEDLAKFKELLEGNPEGGDIASGVVPKDEKSESVAGKHDLTVPLAIEFLADQVKNNFDKARIIRSLKKKWAGKGEAPKRKARLVDIGGTPGVIDCDPSLLTLKKKVITKRNGTLLCIHSYPGANETLLRHWPHFCEFGADRIVGIGTVGGGTQFPCESVEIGENRYMKMKGKDDNLCRRLLNTVKWCLSQPEERFAILEYDTLVLRKMPHWQGVNAHLTGGKVNGSKATQFFHNPWLFDRDSGESLVRAMEAAIGDSAEYPNNSPDLFFGLACERAGIKVGCNFKLFTRNTLDHDLDLACEAARLGAHVIHGVKSETQYLAIMEETKLETA